MLINCVAYQEGRKLGDIAKEDISEYVKRPECFVWVALKDPTPAELAEMEQEFGLHPLAVEDARKGHQRPKIEEYGNSVFAVMQLVMIDSNRVLHEAQRFRSKVIASALAENGAELAASQMMTTYVRNVNASDADGKMKASLNRSPSDFVITAEGTSSGVESRTATVRLQGRTLGTKITVEFNREVSGKKEQSAEK